MTREAFENLYGLNPSANLPVHKTYCARCPSHPSKEPDDEALEFLSMPRELRMLTVFPCAWRREKLCKGWHEACEHGTKERRK